MDITDSRSEEVGELSTQVMAHDSRVISTVNITDGHQETQTTWIEHYDGLFAEEDPRFRVENLKDFVDVDVDVDVAIWFLLFVFCFFCYLRYVFVLLFRLKTKVGQVNKYDIVSFFGFSHELNPEDCKSPPRLWNNTLALPDLYFYWSRWPVASGAIRDKDIVYRAISTLCFIFW